MAGLNDVGVVQLHGFLVRVGFDGAGFVEGVEGLLLLAGAVMVGSGGRLVLQGAKEDGQRISVLGSTGYFVTSGGPFHPLMCCERPRNSSRSAPATIPLFDTARYAGDKRTHCTESKPSMGHETPPEPTRHPPPCQAQIVVPFHNSSYS